MPAGDGALSRIVFPRLDPPSDEGVSSRALVGYFMMTVGCLCGGFIAPIPMMGEKEVGGKVVGDPLGFFDGLVLLLIGVALFVAGRRLSKKEPCPTLSNRPPRAILKN